MREGGKRSIWTSKEKAGEDEGHRDNGEPEGACSWVPSASGPQPLPHRLLINSLIVSAFAELADEVDADRLGCM